MTRTRVVGRNHCGRRADDDDIEFHHLDEYDDHCCTVPIIRPVERDGDRW
ncbi:MAG: hypothetical protein ACRD2W_24030 [Acidimicrobiales bacterium]